MIPLGKREALFLLLGDVVCFNAALWPLLFFRYYGTAQESLIGAHVLPFGILFVVWVVVFFIAGLYEKQTRVLRQEIPSILFKAQAVNAGIAVALFYLFPQFGIAPRANLFIYLILSSFFIFIWRLFSGKVVRSFHPQSAILIGRGEELAELAGEMKGNIRYPFRVIETVDLETIQPEALQQRIDTLFAEGELAFCILDTRAKKLDTLQPYFYKLMERGVRFIDIHGLYEDVFDRVPLSMLSREWFLEDISTSSHGVYDFLKRVMDIALALGVGLLSLVLYPLVFLSVLLDDRGPAFIVQDRVGKHGRPIRILKFRSMTIPKEDEDQQVTRVGSFLRKTRIDELPQLWNVLSGSLSLIGPRPELPALVREYEVKIPGYSMRHLLKPGLSGWAQIYHKNHPHHETNVAETKVKLSYDLYYLKHRSFLLDLKIALRTIQTLLSRSGV